MSAGAGAWEVAMYELSPGPAFAAVEARARAALDRARAAAEGWGRTEVRERVELLARLRRRLAADAEAIADAVRRETGKPRLDALAGDVLFPLEQLRWNERHAPRLLAPQRRDGHWLSPSGRFVVERAPLGAVVIFSPYNYPLQLALVPAATAVLGGNAVVLKPSERAPGVGDLVARLFADAGFPEGLVQAAQGGPELGEALVRAGPDKVFFTGSTAVGRKVLRAAAERLVPVDLELGGQDAMIVFADAHLERAAAAAAWGAFLNAGQVCTGVKRVLVEASVHDEFLRLLREEVGRLRAGGEPDADVGPVVDEAQARRVEALAAEALAQGARAETAPGRAGRLLRPLVLSQVRPEMRVAREEAFGPVLPVLRFEGEGEAVRLANESSYGLGASVWTSDLERARRAARRLVVGSVAINDVVKNIANPAVPFGGEKGSGRGRYHGPEGLHAFTRPLAVMTNKGRARREPNWFPTRPGTFELVSALVRLRHGGDRLRAVLDLARAALRTLRASRAGETK